VVELSKKPEWHPAVGRRARWKYGKQPSVYIRNSRCDGKDTIYSIELLDGTRTMMEAYANDLLPPETTAS
jgi:hypothetical protein